MNPDRLVEAYGDLLDAVAADVYQARAAFLQEHFEGYVAATFLVRDVGYVCWPASTEGRFDAYDDLLEAERAAIAPVERAGFDLLADGLTRVVLATPADTGDYVVKLARCGMGSGFGDGRQANLVEAALSGDADPDAPIVPSLHCSGRGSYAVYPRVDGDWTSTGAEVEVEATASREGTEHAGTVRSVRRWLSERAPWLDVDEAVAPENRCVWNGRLRTLDYSHPGDRAEPLGVPDHVDGEAVVDRVDELRRSGKRRDLRDGGGYVEPGDR